MADRGASLAQPAGSLRNLLRRRRFVVDGGYQYRAAFLAVAVALLLLIILNLSLVFSAREGSRNVKAIAPELREMIEAQDRVQIGLVATGSLVFLVGVFLVSILETHRTAGAAFKIGRSLDRLREGRLDTRLRLRRGDNLQELAASVNAMAGSMQERAWQDVELIEAVAARLEQNAGEAGVAAEAARELRGHAARRRAQLG